MTAAPQPYTATPVSLREIAQDTVRSILDLKVAPAQEKFVASTAVSIAQAYFHPQAWFRAIYAGDRPVGFVMLADDTLLGPRSAAVQGADALWIWRFMIDERFQHLGFGSAALLLVAEHARTRPGVSRILVSHVRGEGGPGRFYRKLGYVYTGDEEDGELVLQLDL